MKTAILSITAAAIAVASIYLAPSGRGAGLAAVSILMVVAARRQRRK